MPLKRPVTLPQARRWPAAAKRRESFCARMGGMRELLTGERAARDPASPINRALATWDCDEPELLRAEHVSKGIRMKITKGKVGSEAKKPARKNPAKKTVSQKISQLYREGYPQKQAVAIALSEQRAGKVKKNPPAYAVVKIGARTPLAVFSKRADAVAFGQSWADIHKAPVRVVAA